ncbi:MAG: hypothetical protein JRE20_00380, partial [Deltaproteobacteria bacterium]|nr:hypothetical protein [Deltaproteobacteria bacterium]
SKYGNHRCLSGMGTPDLLGTYGTYQHFTEDGPFNTKSEGGGKRSKIYFENDTSLPLTLLGPKNTLLKDPKPATIDFIVHRDRSAQAAVIEIQNQTVILKKGMWSKWIKLDFELSTPAIVPDKDVNGICRFYLQEIAPNFRLYANSVRKSQISWVCFTPPDFKRTIKPYPIKYFQMMSLCIRPSMCCKRELIC